MPDSGARGEREETEINLKPGWNSPVDVLAIRYAYLFILGREPESEEVVHQHLTHLRASGASLKQAYETFLESGEYQSKIFFPFVSRRLRVRLEETGRELRYDWGPSSEEILVIQTADAERYAPMLEVSRKYNMRFVKKNSLRYEAFIGLKRGCYPHHATFNRIHMLKELMDSGFRGWVLYLDADCIVSEPGWDIKGHLRSLRENKKVLLLHHVFPPEDPQHEWSNFNAAVFAIDLAANHGRLIVESWATFYDFYGPSDYEKAKNWSDIYHDQYSFTHIVREAQKYLDIRSEIELAALENRLVRAVVRSNDKTISSEEELTQRIRSLEEIGERVWGKEEEAGGRK
jgi:hypothetical protein